MARPRGHGAQRTRWLIVIALSCAAVLPLVPSEAFSSETLADTSFSDCFAEDWMLEPAEALVGCSGGAAEIASSNSVTVWQLVTSRANAQYLASVTVAVTGSAEVTLTVSTASTSASAKEFATNETVVLSTSLTGPGSVALLRFEVKIEPTSAVTASISNPTLAETVPIPTSTPTPTETRTATEVPTGTPTPTPESAETVTATPALPAETSTVSPTTTDAGTPGPTPTGSSTPSVLKQTPVPPVTPVPTSSTTAAPPNKTPTSSTDSGGLLRNGSFDTSNGGVLATWAKFGGDLSHVTELGRGGVGRLVSTTTSTKWVYQTVKVTGGSWYEGAAWARVTEGQGEAFVRLSWYESADGSGSAISTASGATAESSEWSVLTVGPVQAPPVARSARFRLMFRPAGPATVLFDRASFSESAPATATPTPIASGGTSSPTQATTVVTAPGAESTRSPTEIPARVAPSGGPRTLRLSEVLPNPAEPGNDGFYEWVELVNVGDEPVDTSGWRLEDGHASDAIPSSIVGPGDYLIVAGESAVIPSGIAVVRIADGRIGNGLNNMADSVSLIGPDESVVDRVAYGSAGGPEAPPAGRTIGLDWDVDAASPGRTWALTEVMTPGLPNVFPEPVAADETPSVAGAATATNAAAPAPSPPPGTAADGSVPTVTEEEKGSTIPLYILVAAAGAGIGGFGYRYSQSIIRLKDRLTRRG